LQAQTLVVSLSLVPFPQHDPLVHKHFLHNLIFGRVWEHFRAIDALAPFSFTPMSFDTTSALTALHPDLDGYFLFIVKDYEPDQDFELSYNSFNSTFQQMTHLLVSGSFRMVFEHLQDYFHLEDSANGFPQLF
jgi:hypothetical protein